MKRLDREEQRILSAFERGDLKSTITSERALKRYQEYARATLGKQHRVNIRLSAQALVGIRMRAAEEGMPYQTLMASVLHKYATGKLVERRTKPALQTSRTTRKREAA
jgi:predicted DNA binding CopG/RHH family protein